MQAEVNTQVVFPRMDEVAFESSALPESLNPAQILVESMYTLISPGTELAMLSGSHPGIRNEGNQFAKYPFYPGYAAVGTVKEVGTAVSRFQPGDWVFYPGRHAQYNLLTAEHPLVCAIPETFSAMLMPFARIAQIANTALIMIEDSHLDNVAVIGLGLVGNLVAQLLQLQGVDVTGIDRHANRRALAEACGIRRTMETIDVLCKALEEPSNVPRPSAVIEATGSPLAVEASLQAVRRGGQVILLGSTRGRVDLDVYELIHYKGVSLQGAHESVVMWGVGGGLSGAKQLVIWDMLQRIQERQLVIEPLISQVTIPVAIAEAYKSLQHDKDATIGVLVDWRRVR